MRLLSLIFLLTAAGYCRSAPVGDTASSNDGSTVREEAFGHVPGSRVGDGWTSRVSPEAGERSIRLDLGLVLQVEANRHAWYETKLPEACTGVAASIHQDQKDTSREYGAGIAILWKNGSSLKVNRQHGGELGVSVKGVEQFIRPTAKQWEDGRWLSIQWDDRRVRVFLGNTESIAEFSRDGFPGEPVALRLGKMPADCSAKDGVTPGAAGFARFAWIKFFGTGPALPARQPTVPPPLDRKGWLLTWHDEFEGTEIDPGKWAVFEPGKRESAVIDAANASLDGTGHLRLATTEIDGVIHSGMIATRKKFTQTFGRWEARIRFEERQGHHGAFWLLPERNNTEDTFDPRRIGAEIDIVEWFGAGCWVDGGGTACNLYWKKPGGGNSHDGGMFNTRAIIGIDGRVCDDFHTFAVEWTPEEYVFFMDDQEVCRTSQGVSHQPQYTVLSLLCADWEANRLDRSKLPEFMTVDYVRVYQRAPQDGNAQTAAQ